MRCSSVIDGCLAHTHKAPGLIPRCYENKTKIILMQNKSFPRYSFQMKLRTKAKVLHIVSLGSQLECLPHRSDLKGLFHSFEIPAAQLRALSNQSSESRSVPGRWQVPSPHCDVCSGQHP